MRRAMALNLAEFKIRYPDFPKYVWDSPHPYSDVMSIKKDRRNPEHTKRPLNAFMLFAKIQREHITSHFSCNHSEISKALGRLWQELSPEEKEPFTRGAKTLVELHRLEYPDYKYRPRKKGQPKEGQAAAAAAGGGLKKAAAAKSRVRPADRAADHAVALIADRLVERIADRQPLCGMVGGIGSPGGALGMECSPCAPESPHTPHTPHSPLSCGRVSPAPAPYTPYSPVSIGSSSGYESELAHELGAAQEDPLHGFPEPEIDADLRDIEVTALGEAAMLNPLAMFPTLGLTCDDLDELKLHL